MRPKNICLPEFATVDEGTDKGIDDLAGPRGQPSWRREDAEAGGKGAFALSGHKRLYVLGSIGEYIEFIKLVALHELDVLTKVPDEQPVALLLFKSHVEFREEDKPFHVVCVLFDNASVKINVIKSRSG